MEYLIRFIQMHESFRRPETEALADLCGLELEWVYYSDDVSQSLKVEERKGAGRLRFQSSDGKE